MRLPLAVNLKINAFSGAAISDYDSGITNGMVKQKNGQVVVTQRPSIDIAEDASALGADARGRAIYYWSSTNTFYIVNNNTIYKGSQSSAIGTISSGTKKCKFVVLGTQLVLLDAENSQGWTITGTDVVTEITDTDFPPKQSPPVTLAYGAVVLDDALYVLGTDGNLYGSDSTAGSWNALDFIGANRQPDGGSFIGMHHDNIVAFGPRSIEFFYDAGNSVGSPLGLRKDIAYTLGLSSGEMAWEFGDRIFFVGTSDAGSLAVYVLEGFAIKKISLDDLDAFLTYAIVRQSYGCFVSGCSSNGHNFFLITLYSTPSDISDQLTIVYDDTAGLWYPSWGTTIGGHTNFPVIDWTVRDGTLPHYGQGVMCNGDLINMNDSLVPQDTLYGSDYVTASYATASYVTSYSGSTANIAQIIRLGQWDGGTSRRKKCDRLDIIGDQASASQTVTVKRSDGNNDGFATDSGRTVDVSKYRPLKGLGTFRRRNHQLSHSASEMLELEALEVDIQPLAV